MLSVIVCSRQSSWWGLHEDHVARWVGAQHEYVRINNSDGRYNLCSAYNEGVDKSSGDILVFVHEDVSFVGKGWGQKLIDLFADETIGLVGVCGTQKLLADSYDWSKANVPYVKGQIYFPQAWYAAQPEWVGKIVPTENGFIHIKYSQEEGNADVVAVDGLFMAIRASLFDKIAFDEETFNDFHFYDLDISMQINPLARLVVTKDIEVVHYSIPRYVNKTVDMYGKALLNKWADKLPIMVDEKHVTDNMGVTSVLAEGLTFEEFMAKGADNE